MDPGAHGEFCDEDVAAFRKQDGCFGGDHFDFGVGFHDFFDTCQRQLVQFVIVGVSLEVRDYLLPVGSEDVFVGAVEALVDLFAGSALTTL